MGGMWPNHPFLKILHPGAPIGWQWSHEIKLLYSSAFMVGSGPRRHTSKPVYMYLLFSEILPKVHRVIQVH